MANKDTKYTIEVELKGDSKQVQQAIKDGLNKDFSAKIGADTSKLSRDINTAIKELNSSDKKVKIGIDGSNIVKDINNALKSIESDSLKKVKLGTDTSNLLRDINKAITTINSSDSLKKLKLGVDINYLQQQLNKAVRGLDTTVKLKTKLETTSRTSETKGTVTTNKTSKEEAQQYQSLFSKRAASIANLDRAYQEFGRNSKEVSAALREFAAASKDVRKFGRDTGVLSLNKVKSDIERQLGAGLTTDFTKNWLRMEYDKVLKDIDTLNRQLKPEKYERAEDNARVKAYNEEYKIRKALAAEEDRANKAAEKAYKERERVLNEELKIRLALGKKGLSGGLSVEEVKNIKEANQATTALSSQFARLRGEALKAGNALNQATNPKDVERLRAEFQKAIQALVNYQRATRGLTRGGEAQLVEKLAVGNIKEQTEAYKVLVEWIKKAVQAQRDLDVTTGRKLPRKSNDTDLMSWFNNMDIGRAVSGMAYAARGELNAVQAFGNLLSNLSKVSGVVGIMVKGLGALALAGLAVYGVVNTVISAFSSLTGMLGRVANVIYDVLRPGIELYKTRQTAELAIAAAISSRATEGGKEIPFERSINISKEMMERVIADAAMSAFNPQELIDALRGTLPLALGKGWNLAQAYDVTKGVASVAKVINLAPNQVLQELRDILQGTISARSSQVAGATGITSEELKEAEAQGRLYEYIQEHLAKFTVALERYSTTLAGALDRLSETWALGMESVFQRIAPVVNSLINEFIDNFIGVYKDSEGNILRNPADFYTTDETTGEKVYKEAGFEWSEYIQSFGDSLVDLIKFIAPIIDEILAFVQELTGKDDAIKAVVEMIKIAIRVTVSLGEFILSFAMGTIEAMNLMETPISVLISGFIKLGETFVHLVGIGHFMSAAFVEIASTLLQASQMLMVGDIKGLKELPSTISNKIDKFSANYEALTKLGENINTPVATSFAELFGIDRESLQGKRGTVTELVERALNRVNNGSNQPSVDWKQILGTAKEDAKQSYADQRKALQAFIEDLKQTLKEAIADIKDRMEQNDLAYQQGYKSIEDYFTQKSALEYEEAQFRLQTLIAERNAIASLTPTNDSERYQWQRDLIKTDGEIALAQREANKKQDQLVEIAGAIERQLSIRPYQQGLGYNNTNRNTTFSYSVGSNNDLGGAMAELAESAEWATKEMYHAGEGCVEFVTTFGAQFSDLLKEAADNQVWGMSTGTNDITPWLEEHGVQVEYNVPIELAKEIAKAGDIIAVNAGIHAAMAIGGGRVLHNSSSSYRNGDINHVKNVEMDLWDDDTVNIIRTSATMGQNITSLSNATEQLSQEAKDATTKIEQTRKDIAVSYEELQKRMPQAFSKNVQAYLQASQDGQTRWLEAVKNYNLAINNNENMLIAVEASIASVATKLGREAQIMRAKYGQQFPELADALDKMIPIELLKSEAKVWEQYANNRLQMIEDDAKAMNKRLREKSILYPQAIEQYMSYFQQIGEYTITEQLQNLAKVADELAKQGAISDARNITKKIIEMRSKFSSMIQSWIDEMGNYFNYRKELVNADSGLTSFVKEERVKQLEKGQARVNAVAYGQEAMEWAKLEVKYQEQLNKVLANKNEELDKTMSADADILRMNIADLEIAKQRAMRQAEINAKLGEQKTLWQETMDAANQALENGLYNFMTDYINTAESIGEAFRNMAIDILKDLQKFFAKKAITDLMHVITGTPNEQYNVPNHAEMQTSVNTGQMVVWLQNIYNAVLALQTSQASSVFTNVGGTAMGTLFSSGTGGTNSIANRILHHATGGYISGKGTSTSDSIPAMLSNGEYVIKADAVRRYGLNFLDAVNNGHFTRMRTVIPRFADGGYVGDALQDTARGMTDFAKNIGTSVSTTNNMNVALVRNEQEAYEHFMRSPAGQRILVDFQKGNGRVFARFNR